MFLMSVSIHPAMAADAINKELDCPTCGTDDLSSIPGFEGKNIPTVSIREISPENPEMAAAGLTSGTAATVSGAQTKHFSSAITLAIRDPLSGLQANPGVRAAGSPENQDPAFAGIIANMSGEGYDFTGETSARYESTLKSDELLNMTDTQKQSLTAGGFALTAGDTVLSHRDATYYAFTNRTTQTLVYVMGVQRIDAGGNPLGDREYTISPEFNPDGTVVASTTAPGKIGAASSGKSCWWQWLLVSLLAVGLIVLIVILIAVTEGAAAAPIIVGMGSVFSLVSIIGTPFENNWAAYYVAKNGDVLPCDLAVDTPFTVTADVAFSASTIGLMIGVLVVFIALLFAIYLLGVCKGWWPSAIWMNHDWDHEGGDFGLADNGKPVELYVNDRFILSLFADTKADKDAQWTIASKGNLNVRQTSSLESRNGTWQSWIVEAPGAGNQEFSLKYGTTKPVPPTVGSTSFTLPLTVKEIPWKITTVDAGFEPSYFEPDHSMTQYDSLAFDPSGVPHIAYYSEGKYQVMYATLAGGAWSSKKLEDTGAYRSVSLAFDPTGNPGICLGGLNRDMDFTYASQSTAAWSFAKIADGIGWGKVGDGDAGYFSSLVIDPAGTPHIAYNNGKKGDSASLMYATRNGTVWTSTVIQKTRSYNPSMVLDRAGLLHVAYSTAGSGGPIMYAVQDASGTWQVRSVANAYDSSSGKMRHAGYQLSLALDSAENPHITYYDTVNKDLRYVSWNGTDWNTETVHASGDVGKFSSLAINDGDQPFIGYYDTMDQELRFATKNPGSDRWSIHTVDSSRGKPIYQCGVGEYASLALDNNGNPNIAYYDCPNHALKYAGWIG
jgi:hypothetical protein